MKIKHVYNAQKKLNKDWYSYMVVLAYSDSKSEHYIEEIQKDNKILLDVRNNTMLGKVSYYVGRTLTLLSIDTWKTLLRTNKLNNQIIRTIKD